MVIDASEALRPLPDPEVNICPAHNYQSTSFHRTPGRIPISSVIPLRRGAWRPDAAKGGCSQNLRLLSLKSTGQLQADGCTCIPLLRQQSS